MKIVKRIYDGCAFLLTKVIFPIVLLLILVIGVSELYLRMTSKYFAPLVYTFNKKVGFVYDHAASPGIVNDFGFVDKNRTPSDKHRKRVILVGDSFVSGTTLASQLEEDLNRQVPSESFEVIPMGFPGIGLGNMYSFVEEYGIEFNPVAVVAIFNSSTFANNSRILESIKLGAHPDHPMRLFFEESNGQCRRIPIDSDYQQYLLQELPAKQTNTIYTKIDQFLQSTLGRLHLFNWINDIVVSRDRQVFLSRDNEFAFRYFQLRSMPQFNKILSDWYFPRDLDINSMFWVPVDGLPSVFRDALNSTKCTLMEFEELAKVHNFTFVVAISDDCSIPNTLQRDEFNYRASQMHRKFAEYGYKDKVVTVARSTNTHYVDLFDSFKNNQDALHEYQNIHWNDDGISLAAFAISKYIASTLFVQDNQ
ncbi:MAG: hypothetical protein ACP59X_09770 [Solidesulfovibrio sp. DCME]|uniref:hypothetical protein n=1 Tax=Solidesulfovibrio sp. DCME TaxID=3447380 RepID=UPI003D14F645